jgi:hypothetical protein
MHLRTGVQFLAATLLLLSGFVTFLLLIPVPSAFALGMPQDLQCEYFVANRQGWGCARFGNVTTQPIATLLAFSASLIGAISLKLSTRHCPPVHFILLFHWAFFIGLAGLLGSIYFIKGDAAFPYGFLSLVALVSWPTAYVFLKYAATNTTSRASLDRLRTRKMSADIEREILERKAQMKNSRRSEP